MKTFTPLAAFISLIMIFSSTAAMASGPVRIAADTQFSFGQDVAIQGDYAIVGTSEDTAFIFKRIGTSWVEQTKLISPEGIDIDLSHPLSGNQFGRYVDIHGDYAVTKDSFGNLFIFKRQYDEWLLQAELKTLIGLGTVIHNKYVFNYNSNKAFVFKRDGETWAKHQVIEPIYQVEYFTEEGQLFAVDGDYAVFGVGREKLDDTTYETVAYIFKRNGDTWEKQDRLVIAKGRNPIGASAISISGDTIAMTGTENKSEFNYHVLRIYQRQGDSWKLHSRITAPDESVSSGFGPNVSISGDHLVISAVAYSEEAWSSYDEKAAYFYKKEGDSWVYQWKLFSPGNVTDINFGQSLAISGDYALIGAPGDGEKKPLGPGGYPIPPGAAYVYKISQDNGSGCNDGIITLQGFDREYYLMSKLAQTQSKNPQWNDKTIEEYECFLKSAGFSAQSHYATWGYWEGLSPNPYFNHADYLQAKALVMKNKWGYPDAQTAKIIFQSRWPGDTYLHYLAYGAAEGIDPSNSFDESIYLTDLLTLMQSNGMLMEMNIDDLRTHLMENGMTVIDHYAKYGKEKGMKLTPVQ